MAEVFISQPLGRERERRGKPGALFKSELREEGGGGRREGRREPNLRNPFLWICEYAGREGRREGRGRGGGREEKGGGGRREEEVAKTMSQVSQGPVLKYWRRGLA